MNVPYKYTAIFSIQGMSPEGIETNEVLRSDSPALTAELRTEIDRFHREGDYGRAMSAGMLKHMFGIQHAEQSSEQTTERELSLLQSERSQIFGRGPFLTVQIDDVATDWSPSNARENEHFGLAFEAIDKDVLRRRHQTSIDAVIASVTTACEGVVAFRFVTSSFVFRTPDGKPLYSLSFKGSADGTVSKRITDSEALRIPLHFQVLKDTPDLARVQELARASVLEEQNQLRAFYCAFSALEVFANKTFPILRDAVLSNESLDNERMDRVRDNKANLMDKLYCSLVGMKNENLEAEMRLASTVKKVRDEISHGCVARVETFPIRETRALVFRLIESFIRVKLDGAA